MNRAQTNYFTGMLFMLSFAVWVLIGGIAFSQTQTGDASDTPPTAREEPTASQDQGEVIERAIRPGYPRTLPEVSSPKPTGPSPPAPKVFTPSVGGLSPSGTLSKGDRYTAPTPSLTLVANALQLRHKSLSMLITARPGLALTNLVTIRVTYNSAVSGSRWRQSVYDPATGYRDFQNDPEGNRSARHMKLEILLTEQQPNNQFVKFPITWEVDLDPLFDVTITPLRFTLNTNCDRIGNSDIHFLWYAPDASKFREKIFGTKKGRTVTINEFAWARQEVSAKGNLMWPTRSFYDKDPNILSPLQYDIPKPTIKLLPGSSGYVGRTLKDASGQGSCSADTAFDITIRVRQYLNL